MGGGDLKLLFLTGLYLGWQRNLLCLFFACILGIAVGLLTAKKREEKLFVVTLTVDDPAAVSGTAPEEAACTPDNRDNTVVVIGTSCLGSGDDTLGATLMKGFLYALSQQERLPRTILFYNGGAKITTEGSVSIEDLKNMEAQGVEIRTCGTCLNYYGLTDKLAVGSVTNMYDIVETMTSAGKVIRP